MDLLDYRAALRAAAGVVLGMLGWVALSPLYDRVVARSASTLIRLVERPPVTRLRQASPSTFEIDRSDFDPRSPRPVLAIRVLTANVVLVALLFALEKRPFSDQNIRGLFLACVVLYATHVFGVIAKVMSIYALQLGPWSSINYSRFEQNIWGGLSHAYTLVLMYGFAFAVWWVFRSPSPEPSRRSRRSKRA